MKSYGIKSSIYSQLNTGNAVKLLSILPASVKLPDIRAFLLEAITPEIYAYIKDLNDKQDAIIDERRQEIEKRYNEDKKLVPEHWLPLYDISWFDAKLEFLEIKENEYSFTAEDVSITIDETEKF